MAARYPLVWRAEDQTCPGDPQDKVETSAEPIRHAPARDGAGAVACRNADYSSGSGFDQGVMMLTFSSPEFVANGAIPSRFTCDGPDISPPLVWSAVPKGARSLALIVDDPDAPDPAAPKRVWVHCVVYNIPASASTLVEGASGSGLPAGAREGRHDGGGVGYSGPCPPIGRHRYFHKLYAIDIELPDLGARATKADLERAMSGHVLAQAEIIGTYERTKR